MKSCAIITEYNPFHNGHKYQLQKAREKTACDCLVVIMSGNFVQRGEPALISKKERTKIALDNGADLVIELPFYASLQSADNFGKIAVELLGNFNINTLCFGTDYKGTFDYFDFIQQESNKQNEINSAMKKITKDYPDFGYPKRLAMAYEQVFGQKLFLDKPNHILGLSYARANLKLNKPMELLAIERIGASHYDGIKENYASASAIRNLILSENDMQNIKQVVPEQTLLTLQNAFLHNIEQYYPLLKSQILTKSIDELNQIYQMSEGLEYRIKKITPNSHSFTEWINNLQTKRYTTARLQRLAMYLILNLTKDKMTELLKYRYIKVLGFNQFGREFLKGYSGKDPLITSIRQQDKQILEYEQRIDEIYHLPENNKFNFSKMYQPIII